MTYGVFGVMGLFRSASGVRIGVGVCGGVGLALLGDEADAGVDEPESRPRMSDCSGGISNRY
jgi:hypothetical protein